MWPSFLADRAYWDPRPPRCTRGARRMRCQTACCHSTMTIRTTSRDECITLSHGWRVPNHLWLLRAPYPRAWNDHRSLDWRKSACCSPGAVVAQRARGLKNTHGGVPRVYSYGHISHGRRGPERPLKAVSACSMKNLSKVIARKSPARDKG